MEIKIRKMNTEDVDKVMKIELKSFSMPWSRETYISDLCSDFGEYIVADVNGEIAGYGGIFIILDEAHVVTIAIAENFKSQGIGKTIMEKMLKIAISKNVNKVFLEVRVSNIPAIKLYKKLGFQKIAVRKAYYTDNMEDAYIMQKEI